MRDGRSWFVLISCFIVLGGWYFYYINKSTTIEPRQTTANGEVIFSNDRSDKGDAPFILTAKLLKETSSELVLEIEYFLSDSIDGDYNISIHPNMGDWAYSANTMRAGLNKEIITVSFRGKESPSATSDTLHLYINHYDKARNKWIGKVFDRTIRFEKHWKK